MGEIGKEIGPSVSVGESRKVGDETETGRAEPRLKRTDEREGIMGLQMHARKEEGGWVFDYTLSNTDYIVQRKSSQKERRRESFSFLSRQRPDTDTVYVYNHHRALLHRRERRTDRDGDTQEL